MSNFYGTLTTDKGQTTRAGHRYITATAQSYQGSVSVTLEPIAGDKDNLMVEIAVSEGPTSCPRNLALRIKLADLLTCPLKLWP